MSTSRSICRRLVPVLKHGHRRAFSVTAAARATEHVRIVEVGPRDGLQNEKATISLETKLELIRRLAQTGLTDLEAGSFVAPKWVPQMANSAEVLNYILGNPPQSTHHMNYNFLVPNLRGLQNFLKASEDAESSDKTPPGDIPTPPPSPKQAPEFPSSNTSTQDPNEMPSRPVWQQDEEPQPDPSTSTQNPNDMPPKPVWQQSSQSTPRASPAFDTEVSIFAAATEAFSKANTNCSIAESMERFKPIIELAKEKNIRVRGYVSVALGCPYEGPDVDPVKVADITRTLLEMGADEVSIADTTGMGTAPRTRELLKALTAAGIANQDLALHFHDTYGQALVNTVVGLEHGIRTFDSSVGGLGGCPYSKGATGNVATEDLVYTLHSLGVQTGIDVHKVAEIGSWISKELGRSNDTRAGKAILSRLSEKMP